MAESAAATTVGVNFDDDNDVDNDQRRRRQSQPSSGSGPAAPSPPSRHPDAAARPDNRAKADQRDAEGPVRQDRSLRRMYNVSLYSLLSLHSNFEHLVHDYKPRL